MRLSKTLDVHDYMALGKYARHIDQYWDIPGREEHPHRKWEYSIAYKTLEENGTKSVLDVGGGGSRFAPIMMMAGMGVLQVDPADNDWLITAQSKAINKLVVYDKSDFMQWNGPRYDAVTCISVLEHIPDDLPFFMKLVRHVKQSGVLFITVDFSQTGKALCGLHLRTYTEEMLFYLAEISGMQWIDGHDYTWHGNHVYDWTFASMALKVGVAT